MHLRDVCAVDIGHKVNVEARVAISTTKNLSWSYVFRPLVYPMNERQQSFVWLGRQCGTQTTVRKQPFVRPHAKRAVLRVLCY